MNSIRKYFAIAAAWTCLFFLQSRAADVAYFVMAKTQFFSQTNSSTPAYLASNAWVFSAFSLASSNKLLTNATITPYGKTARKLLMDTNELTFR